MADQNDLWGLMSASPPPPSNLQKKLFDDFIEQYMMDFDAYAACVRMGVERNIVVASVASYMSEGYVQREIYRRTVEDDKNPGLTLKRKKKLIEALLFKRAQMNGTDCVAALSKLCNILDMDGTTKIKADVHHRGGVMMVPAIASVDEWEKAATASQNKLMEDARH